MAVMQHQVGDLPLPAMQWLVEQGVPIGNTKGLDERLADLVRCECRGRGVVRGAVAAAAGAGAAQGADGGAPGEGESRRIDLNGT